MKLFNIQRDIIHDYTEGDFPKQEDWDEITINIKDIGKVVKHLLKENKELKVSNEYFESAADSMLKENAQIEPLKDKIRVLEVTELGLITHGADQEEQIKKLEKNLIDCNSIKKGHHARMKKAIGSQGKLLKQIRGMRELIKLKDLYLKNIRKDYHPAHRMASLHGYVTPEARVKKGLELREKIKLLETNLNK